MDHEPILDCFKNRKRIRKVSKLRVLIADDSELIQSVLSEIFSSDEGIQVVDVAGNGLEALEKVRHHKPDIATIDINMPVMGGLEAIENIMSECAIPILVISDVSDSKAAFTALSSGALDVISKKDISSDEAHHTSAESKATFKGKSNSPFTETSNNSNHHPTPA